MNFVYPSEIQNFPDGIQFPERRRQMGHRRFQLPRRPQSGAAPDQQIKTKVVFQCLDPLANSGRSDRQFCGGGFHGARTDRRFESLKCPEMGGVCHALR
jgi:hypothetical protein